MRYTLLCLIIFVFIGIFAQYGAGEMPFPYLNISVSPVNTALSNSNTSTYGGNQDIYNPASIVFYQMNGVYFSYLNHIGMSHFGYIEYNMPNIRFSLKYFNSGTMEMRDSLNQFIRDFSTNMILINTGYGYKINEKMFIGAGMTAGMENIDDFMQYAAGFSAGFIYDVMDFLDLGIYFSNAGVSYYEGKIEMLPARIIAGAKLGAEDMPVDFYMDIGKILDENFYYALGLEWDIIGRSKVKSTALNETAFINEIKTDENKDNSMNIILDEIENNESEDIVENEVENDAKDGIENDIADELEDDAEGESSVQSYEDYLIMLEKEEKEKEEKEITAKTKIEEAKIEEKKRDFTEDFNFVFRAGVSSDKQKLKMGTQLDLYAGLTAGFGLSYKNYTIDYAAKFWGELGIGHSIGAQIRF